MNYWDSLINKDSNRHEDSFPRTTLFIGGGARQGRDASPRGRRIRIKTLHWNNRGRGAESPIHIHLSHATLPVFTRRITVTPQNHESGSGSTDNRHVNKNYRGGGWATPEYRYSTEQNKQCSWRRRGKIRKSSAARSPFAVQWAAVGGHFAL